MLFNSFVFLFVFLPLVVVAYFLTPQHRARLVLIVIASYVFYGWWDWRFLSLLALSTVVDIHVARAMNRSADTARLRQLLAPAEVPVATMLDWVAEWTRAGRPLLGKPTHFETRDGTF